jgi:hypothetical protein
MREIQAAVIPTIGAPRGDEPGERTFIERWHAAESQARTELGKAYDLVEIGEAATIEGLVKELEVQTRLDALIERSIKRMLLARGLKSMSTWSHPTPPESLPTPQVLRDEK